MRLIDADMLKANCKYNREFRDKFKDVDLNTLPELIDAQPTAYDPKGIVGKLYGLKRYKNKYDSYYDNELYQLRRYANETINDTVDKAIEIVEAGGRREK